VGSPGPWRHTPPFARFTAVLQCFGPFWASKADVGVQIDFVIDFWLILSDMWSIFNGFPIDAVFF
jgi:hypothetical protein